MQVDFALLIHIEIPEVAFARSVCQDEGILVPRHTREGDTSRTKVAGDLLRVGEERVGAQGHATAACPPRLDARRLLAILAANGFDEVDGKAKLGI